MLQKIQFWDASLANTVIVNELTPPLRYPVEVFHWEQPTRGDELPKMEEGGNHDRYADNDAMPLTMQGHFLADTTTQYWQIRKALMSILVPTSAVARLYRYHSHVQIKLDGDSETYWANLIRKDYDCPLEANYPTVTPFQFQWEIAFGYWRKLSDNSIALI